MGKVGGGKRTRGQRGKRNRVRRKEVVYGYVINPGNKKKKSKRSLTMLGEKG